eukprot:240945-Pleurochrysis_carterae.AAC.2
MHNALQDKNIAQDPSAIEATQPAIHSKTVWEKQNRSASLKLKARYDAGPIKRAADALGSSGVGAPGWEARRGLSAGGCCAIALSWRVCDAQSGMMA